jgi:gluconate 2-dehydrogenase gamma chain
MAGIAAYGVVATSGAAVITGKTVLPTALSKDGMPVPSNVRKGGLAYLTPQEARTVAAVFDRLIPADALSISASEAGCVEFVDSQLAGDFGKGTSTYRGGPFEQGTAQQGPQFRQTPAQRYRMGLIGLDVYASKKHGKPFADLDAHQQDGVITDLEANKVTIEGTDSKAFFELMLKNVREGFFSDPMYGGNKGMAGWKMLGFPGARYDYRDQIGKKGQKLNLIPISMVDHSA